MSRTEQVPVAPYRDREKGCGAALLIIDMINPFDFEGAQAILPAAKQAVHAILHLREQADRARIPTIYVNDNFGEWHCDRSVLVERVGKRIIHRDIVPRKLDYFVIKPQFSGFYATNLQVLLPKLGVTRLVLTGVASDICVLFTAVDARMRDYDLWIPKDAVAAEKASHHKAALAIAKDNLDAETKPASALSLAQWIAQPAKV